MHNVDADLQSRRITVLQARQGKWLAQRESTLCDVWSKNEVFQGFFIFEMQVSLSQTIKNMGKGSLSNGAQMINLECRQ